jgi:hypothetical protein
VGERVGSAFYGPPTPPLKARGPSTKRLEAFVGVFHPKGVHHLAVVLQQASGVGVRMRIHPDEELLLMVHLLKDPPFSGRLLC